MQTEPLSALLVYNAMQFSQLTSVIFAFTPENYKY